MTRRSFAVGAAAALAGAAGWTWLTNVATDEDSLPWPFRRVLDFNQRLSEEYFSGERRAPEFPSSAATAVRVNGRIGLDDPLDAAAWRLHVTSEAAQRRFTLDEIKALPRTEMTTELKCIEGWSNVVQWAGVSLRDFTARFQLGTRSGDAPDPAGRPGDLYAYAALATPDEEYYVGLDAASAFQPQTLLCYEMNGDPLTEAHGAPLRLVIPVKYGIKNIKRIGTLTFTDRRPPDYWARRGYDWYAGH
jgi:DMSO/TMAO reductase YedYZ molybdopterin-dependent catalytic subunit